MSEELTEQIEAFQGTVIGRVRDQSRLSRDLVASRDRILRSSSELQAVVQSIAAGVMESAADRRILMELARSDQLLAESREMVQKYDRTRQIVRIELEALVSVMAQLDTAKQRIRQGRIEEALVICQHFGIH